MPQIGNGKHCKKRKMAAHIVSGQDVYFSKEMSTTLHMLFLEPRPSCTHSGLLDQALSLIHGKQMTYKEQNRSLEVEIKEPS